MSKGDNEVHATEPGREAFALKGDSSTSQLGAELPDRESAPPRRGDTRKCPVCGSPNDPEAFYCAKCRNYFCFHCRARSLPSETQLQCINQACEYYGKLVCSICDPVSEKDEPPSVYAEPQDGYWPAWLLLVLIVSGFLWYFSSSFVAAILFAIMVYAGGGYFFQKMLGWNLFGAERLIEQQRKSSFHTCVHCQQPVKELPRGNIRA